MGAGAALASDFAWSNFAFGGNKPNHAVGTAQPERV
jgi:hypothetical protein